MQAVKIPAQSDAALGQPTPLSQRHPTLPPPAAAAEHVAPKKKEPAEQKPVDPRGITLPALEQARLKPPKA